MTNEMLQTNYTKAGDTQTIRLLVAMEMSLKTWRLAMPEAGKAKKHLAGNDYSHRQASRRQR